MEEIKVLDHGYVKEIDFWGSDERIIESARMSTNKGFLGWGICDGCVRHMNVPFAEQGSTRSCSCALCSICKGEGWLPMAPQLPWSTTGAMVCNTCAGTGRSKPGDEKLLKYLWDNGHHTPFEMAGLTIEVQAPIFIFREWHRHRTQSYNELSARYTPMPDVHYMPTAERCLQADPLNKQAGALAEANAYNAEEFLKELESLYEQSERVYQSGLRRGVPKEIARLAVTVGRYSRMRASGNLRNWLHFAGLRTGRGAQREIQEYASAVVSIIEEKFPRTYALWRSEGR